MTLPEANARKRRRGSRPDAGGGVRQTGYHRLRNPFTPATVFSEDRVVSIHETALRVIEELGIKVLLPEARDIFAAAGARSGDGLDLPIGHRPERHGD